MKLADFQPMESPVAAFYMLVLTEALSGMAGGVYSSRVPEDVQREISLLVDYFRMQLPEGGFMVLPSDWE